MLFLVNLGPLKGPFNKKNQEDQFKEIKA